MNQNAMKLDFLYENLKRELSRLAPGERFLSVRDIMREYNVSQQMVERALDRFTTEGRLEVFYMPSSRSCGKIISIYS